MPQGRQVSRQAANLKVETRDGKKVLVRDIPDVMPKSRLARQIEQANQEISRLTNEITEKQEARTSLVTDRDALQALYDEVDE